MTRNLPGVEVDHKHEGIGLTEYRASARHTRCLKITQWDNTNKRYVDILMTPLQTKRMHNCINVWLDLLEDDD